MTFELRLSHLTLKLLLGLKANAGHPRQLIQKPKTGIVPGLVVFRTWIAQTDD